MNAIQPCYLIKDIAFGRYLNEDGSRASHIRYAKQYPHTLEGAALVEADLAALIARDGAGKYSIFYFRGI